MKIIIGKRMSNKESYDYAMDRDFNYITFESIEDAKYFVKKQGLEKEDIYFFHFMTESKEIVGPLS